MVLASTSRYRRELLERLGLPFSVQAPRVDEQALPGETPRQLAHRLSEAKAAAVADSLAAAAPHALVIGSDQTATLDGLRSLGKPGDHARAVEQLTAASGRTLTFHSGMTLRRADGGYHRTVVVDTRVRFRPLSAAQIETYLLREQPYDCAGSAKAEALGIALIESLQSDDPTAIVGLPLIALTTLLTEAGLAPLGA
ncbi:MAG: Maf family nucleotide pyrophosphatase [Burkholderiaceae bacterium]